MNENAENMENEEDDSSFMSSVQWVIFWIMMSILFCIALIFLLSPAAAFTWGSCYLIEKLLSFDNLFMFHIIFKYFGTSKKDQHSALNWGIIGAIVLRGCFLLGMIGAVSIAPWLMLVCGAFLLFSGLKMLFWSSGEDDNEPGWLVKKFKEWFPWLSTFFLTICAIEITDLLFALDSIPAALSITTDFFILATANLFAILGLRSMYHVMQEAIEKWHFLDAGVSTILCGLGLKMLLAPLILIPTPFTFAFILTIMAVSIGLSMMKECANTPLAENEIPSVTKRFCTFFFTPEVREPSPQLEEEEEPCPSLQA